MRKALAIAAGALIGFAAAGVVFAQEDLAKKNGCLGCHDVNAKKVGPSFKSVAEQFKGKPDAEATILKVVDSKKHPPTKASEADKKSIIQWILSL